MISICILWYFIQSAVLFLLDLFELNGWDNQVWFGCLLLYLLVIDDDDLLLYLINLGFVRHVRILLHDGLHAWLWLYLVISSILLIILLLWCCVMLCIHDDNIYLLRNNILWRLVLSLLDLLELNGWDNQVWFGCLLLYLLVVDNDDLLLYLINLGFVRHVCLLLHDGLHT